MEHNVFHYVVTAVIIALTVILFERQNDVTMEEDYLQVGNSPFHYFRSDEIKEIKFKGDVLVIKTRNFWRTGRYHVRKKQCIRAHQLIAEWAHKQEITYIRIF